ncbi:MULTISPECIES: YetF domain-containing protein [Lysinibacillus]|uniref:DUF421 domain-containing protein n=1 Tax=Lysinibacillus pinottii TaxID=2973932 RepID=A0ABT2DND7_9BACI|nr:MULTISPECIES: YetF domain-containing protein [Lysinibacillus]MCS1396425.1 DUF421 domain-containing protein [Lysinibacillus sp. PB211]MDR0158836.1 DUF421 domain-containing protein [Lysinibacillus sphaericus]
MQDVQFAILETDGQLIYENLVELELTDGRLMKKLKKQKVQNVKDVYFAQVQTNGSLYKSER